MSANYTDIVTAKAELWSLITRAELLVETDYTRSSWAIFKAQEQLAINTYNDSDSTLAEVNSMIDMMNGLSGFEGLTDAADLTALRTQILRAQSLNKQNYNATDWNNLQLVLNDAIEVYNDIDPTQSDVDKATEDLKNCLDNLLPDENPIDIDGKNVRFRWGNLADYEDPSLLSTPRNDTLYFTNQGQLFKGIIPISSVIAIDSDKDLPPLSITNSQGNPISNDGSYEMIKPTTMMVPHKIYAKMQSDGSFLAYYSLGNTYRPLDLVSLNVSKLKGILPMSKGGVGSDLSQSVGQLTEYDHLLKYSTTDNQLVAAERGIDYIHSVTTNNTDTSAVSISKVLSTSGSTAGLLTLSVSHKSSDGYYHLPSGGTSGQVLIRGGLSGLGSWHTLSYNDLIDTPEIPVTELSSCGEEGLSLVYDGEGPELSLKRLSSDESTGVVLRSLYSSIDNEDGSTTSIPRLSISLDSSIIPNKSSIQSAINSSVIVYASSTENIDITSVSQNLVLDNTPITNNTLVLLKDQTIESENGIYKYSNGSLVRSAPLELSSDYECYKSITIYIEAGDTLCETIWSLIGNDRMILDVTPLKFYHLAGTIKHATSSGVTDETEGESEVHNYLGDWLFQGNLEGSILETVYKKSLYGKFYPYTDPDLSKMLFYYGVTPPTLGSSYNPETPSTSLESPDRLNFNGVLYATKLFSDNKSVSVDGHTHYMTDYYNDNIGSGYSSYDSTTHKPVADNPEIIPDAGGDIKPSDTLEYALGRLDHRINKLEDQIVVVSELPEWMDSYIGKIIIVVDGGYKLESDNSSIIITDTLSGANIDIQY